VLIVLILLKVFEHRSRAVEIFSIDQFALSNTSSVALFGIGTRAAFAGESYTRTKKEGRQYLRIQFGKSFPKLA